jgi:type I restriction enzyme M protein
VAGLINLFSKDIFNRPDGSDVLGRAYMYFIANFASTEGTRGGEFFTPQAIVKLLVEMLGPTQGIVFDPAAGSGGMFIQSEKFTDNGHRLSFYGQESIETTLRLGKMNLMMHGLDGDIKLGNSLLADQHPTLRAGYIITNPPFNLQSWGADKLDDKDARLDIGYQKGQVTNGNANYMWMMHYLYHLAGGGTAGFVMANGAMTTNQTAEKHTRTALIEEGFVDCIVQLPDKLFPNTGIPCCLFFLSKNRPGTHDYRPRRNQILFIDARQMGEMLNRRQRTLTEADIKKIAEAYHAYRIPGRDLLPAEPGFCRVATLDEVKQHDYKLTPGIYVGTQANDDDGEPFAEKMPRLTQELRDLFAQSDELQRTILDDLEELL